MDKLYWIDLLNIEIERTTSYTDLLNIYNTMFKKLQEVQRKYTKIQDEEKKEQNRKIQAIIEQHQKERGK